jgi:uncharacterized Fe-S cluster protein YjdI/CDGSH-type Zn-finger protein
MTMEEAPGQKSPSPGPPATRRRVYQTDAIAVRWEPEYCIHSANCIRGLPRVFNPRDRPWVHVDAADADAIARVIATCPTGALHYTRLDGAPDESPDTPSITPVRDGPLYLRGDIDIRDEAGNLIRRDTRVALCRCGHTGNAPFCDNTHRAIGFQAPDVAKPPPA